MRAKPVPMEEQYQLVLECRQSGLSDHNWCLEKGIKPGTFYNWVKRLRKIGTYEIPKPAGKENYKATQKQDVVKVELVDDPGIFEKAILLISAEEAFLFYNKQDGRDSFCRFTKQTDGLTE